MKKITFFILPLLLVMGCGPGISYYTNSSSQGYRQQALGALCEKCNRQFNISGYQLDYIANITCPYCGHAQDTRMASNRWGYAVQQQQAYANQASMQAIGQTLQNINQIQRESAQRKQQIYQDHINKSSQLGTSINPINVKIKDY